MIYRGKVTAVTATTATVLVTDLDPVQSFGPLSCVGAVPAVGDIVLVVEVGDNGSSLPDLVVVNPTTKTQLDAKVAGPASSTDNAIVRYDGTTGKVVQNSGVTISDSGGVTVVGGYVSVEPSSGSSTLYVSAAASGSTGDVQFQTAGSNRWTVRKTSDAESGSDVGSNFTVVRRSDTGAQLSIAITIDRATGKITLADVGGTAGLEFGSSGPRIMSGANTPEGAVTAPIGSLWLRTNGGAGTTLYVKESGTGNTGWIAK